MPVTTIRTREIGRLLRQAQQHADLTGDHLAALINVSASKMSRILHGWIMPSQLDAAVLLTACGVNGDAFRHVVGLAHPRNEPCLLRLGMAEQWAAYLAHSSGADRVIEYQPFMVPWLAQSPGYTAALPEVVTGPTDRHRAAGLLKLSKIKILISEWALRAEIGDRWQMQQQLRYLLRLSERPGVSIRAIGAEQPGCLGIPAFSLVESHDYPTFVHREDLSAGVFVDDMTEVAQYEAAVDHLTALALDDQESHDLIGQLAVKYGGPIPTRPLLTKL